MSQLSEQTCQACRSDAPQVADSEIAKLLMEIPDWDLITVDGVKQLQRHYKFKNFRSAMAFSNQVAELAEAEGHHPAILTEWGSVVITWWTHAINGLHHNDFVCAAKTDALSS